ncbi:MAG: bifunctional glutamate N-acetyltransferase/amino-acid acetyltransferase ArgJ [bacterium]|nr:bifunctional glutamate N-acetyltransferase/amino-acid acetyltransferase ArgJ [bacterium]
MKVLQGGLENVPGYTFSAIQCGIRYKDRLDYSIIISDRPCVAAGTFTTNKIFAAPIKLCRERIDNPIQAILVNSTNANACTGDEGYTTACALTADIASRLSAAESSILMSSTGIIGRQLPLEKMKEAHEELLASKSAEMGKLFPEAIMTTDTFPKSVSISFTTSKGEYVMAGTAKGSGMIAPDMATLLAYVITDAPMGKTDLDTIFKRIITKSLNSITIDGDMSTNDTAIILSPQSESPLTEDADIQKFEEALERILIRLSKMLVSDGEGATKFVNVTVTGALSNEDAQQTAKTIAESALVKTAFFGMDPNWGRIAMAAGNSGVEMREESLCISFEGITLLEKGTPVDFDNDKLVELLSQKEFTVLVDLGLGKGSATMMTSDLSYDYIKINAEYST